VAHTYAHLGEFNDFLRDNGTTSFAAETAAMVARKLGALEAASRRVDAFCDRSRFGSGFGPRIASNRYDSSGASSLDLHDDFLSFSSVAALAGTGGASTSIVEDTDFYAYPLERSQKRRLQLNLLTNAQFYWGFRTVTVAGRRATPTTPAR
jgi:hypothetical protein